MSKYEVTCKGKNKIYVEATSYFDARNKALYKLWEVFNKNDCPVVVSATPVKPSYIIKLEATTVRELELECVANSREEAEAEVNEQAHLYLRNGENSIKVVEILEKQ